MNPLLDFSDLPRFASFQPAHVSPAIDELLTQSRALIARLTSEDTPVTWDNFVQPMEDQHERLGRAWGVVGHLHGVLDSPELREAYNENQPKIVDYYTELGQNLALFNKYKALRASSEYRQLDTAQRKIIDNEIRDFRLSGAELSDAKKQRFAEVSSELAQLTTRFSENVLDATNAFALYIENRDDLAGIPDDVLEAAHAEAQQDGKSGWKLTLRAPSYIPVMQYADNRALREQVYRAYATRASEFGKTEWDNTPLIRDILRLRREEANLLGYANYAEVSLVPKMANSPHEVLDFLNDLAEKAKPFARRDYDELKSFAADELGLKDLQSWDLGYASEKLRAQRYAFSEQEVKQYFPEAKVLEGMFRVVSTIYGLHFTPQTVETWDPSVRFFNVLDRDDNTIGRFYLDLYARESKRGGAWMDDVITRRLTAHGVQTPVAYLICNFSAPVGNRPALLSHDEIQTLFHEFGHCLHHLLTRVDRMGVSGINGVEWDAIELPSQFMENFCWEWEVLRHMSAHVGTGASASSEQGSRSHDANVRESGAAPLSQTTSASGLASPEETPASPADGAPLPRALFDKMIAAKNFQSGMQTVRQLEFSLFDMQLHENFDPANDDVARLLQDIRQQVAVAMPPAFNRFQNSFSHIFSGGYGAGYYSYKWAELLSADAYSLFEENGVLDPTTGAKFRDEILAVGGSRPALESFIAFRGRPPKVDALLRHNGMIAAH